MMIWPLTVNYDPPPISPTTLPHAAVRCNVVISVTCQSYDKVVSEEYLGTTVPGNGCWSEEPPYSGGLGMTSQGIPTFALCKVVFPINIIPSLI